MASRLLSDLHPKVAAKANAWLADCKAAGLDILVTCTYRSSAEQDALYAQGRTKPGPRVTNARGGQSFHNYHVALDFVPIVNGKPEWRTSGSCWALWKTAGELAEKHGFEWAARWKTFKETAHIQFTGGHDLAFFQRGGTLA